MSRRPTGRPISAWPPITAIRCTSGDSGREGFFSLRNSTMPALPRHAAPRARAVSDIEWPRRLADRRSRRSRTWCAGCDAGHRIEPRRRDRAFGYRDGERLAEIGGANPDRHRIPDRAQRGAAGFVECARAPIRHHPAGETPVLAGGGLGSRAASEISRRRECRRGDCRSTSPRRACRCSIASSKSEQIGFAQRRQVELRASSSGGAVGLLIVDGEMLNRGDDVLFLDAADGFTDHRPGKQRVLTGIIRNCARCADRAARLKPRRRATR